MRWCFLILALAACDSPSLEFARAPVTRVDVGDMSFAVRIKGERAETIRTSRHLRPREGAVLQNAQAAITQVSGCEVKTINGDQAIQRATLKCDGQPGDPLPYGGRTVIITVY